MCLFAMKSLVIKSSKIERNKRQKEVKSKNNLVAAGILTYRSLDFAEVHKYIAEECHPKPHPQPLRLPR